MPEIIGVPFHKIEPSDKTLSEQALRKLEEHYPLHGWTVGVDSENGVMYVFAATINLVLKKNYGFILHLDKVYQDPTLQLLVKAGGEMLERAGMKRGRWNEIEFPTHVEGVNPKHQPSAWLKG